MDNGITLTTPAPFVVNVVQITGGSAGFDINLAGAKFQILVNLATDGGTSPLVGEEYTSVEKNKLANIEVNAKDDLTGSEIKVLYELENDTNAFTDLEQAKLGDIEADATADQTGLEIKTAYELEANTNAYTDVEKIKLATIMAGATDDLTGAEIKVLYESEGNTNAYTDTEKTKLSLIEDNATKDQTPTEIESLYGSRVPQVSGQEITDGFEANVRRFSPDQIEAMIVIHAPVIDALTDQEVEEAYNRQVDQASAGELAAGTETAVRRVSPADLKTAVLAHETGGGGEDNPDQVSAQEIIDGTEPALRSFSPDDIEAMAVLHGGGGGGMSDAAVKIAYENNPDTNEFSDAEKTALGTMESGATGDQTDSEIRTAVANANDSNVFTDNNESKLGGIETAAKDDQTDAEIRAAVEAANDSNVFTDADHSKLDAIGADVDFYDLGMDFLGKPTDGQIIARWVVLREITMAADFAGAAGNILVNPTATLAIDIKDDGTTIGTVSISTSGVFTFTTAGGTAKVVAAGSVVTATAPATADTTGSDIVFTLPGAL